MRGETGRHVFSGVDVGLPSKVRSSEAEEEWQEVDWVTWSTGELSVDGDSFLLVFKPSGASGSVKDKPLGSLIRASAVSGSDDEGRTFVVTTSDTLHRLYRMTFQSAHNASDFTRLATAAEAANAALEGAKDAAAARSGDATAAEAEARLEADIRQKLAGRWPLVFGGAELCGPDPGGAQAGGEVLLGRGAAVLLDPPEDTKSVGSYELIFYGEDEGAQEPVKRFLIGPKMTLTKQAAEGEDEDGPAATFAFAAGLQGVPAHTIAFDSAIVAAAFARDFRVRQRIMELSLKTVKRGRAADELRSEIEGLKSQTLSARFWRFLCLCVVLLALTTMARVCTLYVKDKGARKPAAYFADLARDARTAARLSRSALAGAGSKACELAFGSVPADDVRRCAALADSSQSVTQVSRCLKALVPP